MKTIASIVAAIALLSPLTVSAADFEGTVKMNMTDSRESTMPVTFSLKGTHTRMDFNAGEHSGGMIMEASKPEVIILMPQQKMYMVQSTQGHPGMKGQAEADPGTTVEKTDQKEKILGYDTTKYLAKSKEGTTEIWITEELGTFLGIGAGRPMGGRPGGNRGGASQAWEQAFKGKQAFPLRVVTTSAKGKSTFKMEATAIDKKSLPDSMFQPPADYQKFDMGAMMRGMGMPGGMQPPPGNQGE